ncbi:hypothetical protein K469DRAFT_121593 [Zopfia rhizophila CBS 207.26]|uniref:Uncharacterized protein n=1 Tax=Zopfia rhizophila CBS 207.26 TaxID=1314779 RepID=A0A6A6E8Z6_9PEZI|nr:hypothetical protein K469DRAFT_121593 [Zopfia rhizophila CBS 207.26]
MRLPRCDWQGKRGCVPRSFWQKSGSFINLCPGGTLAGFQLYVSICTSFIGDQKPPGRQGVRAHWWAVGKNVGDGGGVVRCIESTPLSAIVPCCPWLGMRRDYYNNNYF